MRDIQEQYRLASRAQLHVAHAERHEQRVAPVDAHLDDVAQLDFLAPARQPPNRLDHPLIGEQVALKEPAPGVRGNPPNGKHHEQQRPDAQERQGECA